MKRLALACALVLSPPALARDATPSDEAALLYDAARAEDALRASPLVERDPELNAYLSGVLRRIAPDKYTHLRLYIINLPEFGARTLPNGAIEIGAGLVWRAANEAQLGFILSREVAHYSSHHALEALRTERRGHDVVLVADLAAASLGAYFASDLIDLGLGGAVRGLAQNREREADRLGMRELIAAGYDGAEAFALSNALAGEARAGRARTPSQHQSIDLDRAAPTTRGRLTALRQQISRTADTPADAALYRQHIRPFLARWLAADLERRDFSASLFAFDRLASAGDDLGIVHFYRGEALRQRRGDGDLSAAAAAYRLSISYADAPAEAWRQLGDLEARVGRIEAARAALQKYLERAPAAEDRALIEARLEGLPAQ